MEGLSRLPLYLQVKNYITAMIDSGKYLPDSKLPTEKELMEALSVGRATVRAALMELEHEGVIYKRHGVGTFVCAKKRLSPFEPIISFTYSLEKMGLEIRNVVISSGLERPSGELLEHWDTDMTVGRISRLRLAGGEAVAMEDSYFTKELYDIVKVLKPEISLAHAILSSDGVNVERVDMRIVLREADKNERSQLKLKNGERVAELTRWTFDGEKAVNFVRFVVCERFVQIPFGE
ncbi:MAG: GntR family transcriptional regulator [Clostridia bacterium]|nr:GntR family transcriptional regulator [Clostridia bacterium]